MPENKNSKAKIEANNRYNAKAYEEIKLRVKKGEKDLIKSYAESKGKSLNAYISDLIRQLGHGVPVVVKLYDEDCQQRKQKKIKYNRGIYYAECFGVNTR